MLNRKEYYHFFPSREEHLCCRSCSYTYDRGDSTGNSPCSARMQSVREACDHLRYIQGPSTEVAHRLLVSPSRSKMPAFFRADMTAASVALSGDTMGSLLGRGDLADLADLGRDVARCERDVGVLRRLGDCKRDTRCGCRQPAASFAGEGDTCNVQWSEGCADCGRTEPSAPACCTHSPFSTSLSNDSVVGFRKHDDVTSRQHAYNEKYFLREYPVLYFRTGHTSIIANYSQSWLIWSTPKSLEIVVCTGDRINQL